jgi:uncharacterized protein (TIGR03437 family)
LEEAVRLIAFLLLTLTCLGASVSVPAQPRALAFEAREGAYLSHGPGYSLSVTQFEASLRQGGRSVRMSLEGASPSAAIEALDRMPGKANYILGDQVRRSYELYGRLRIRHVYSGIDLEFLGNQQHLEYDLDIAPGGDPAAINIIFSGIDAIRVDPNGDLVLDSGEIEIRQPKPVAYQTIAGERKLVDVTYRLDGSNRVRFRVGPYDHSHELVIDPELVFNNLFGGSGSSSASAVALDSQGNIYLAGATSSADFPVQNATRNHPGAAPLLSSSDGGQTWTTPAIGTAGFVRSIVSAPTSPSILYAAAGTGVVKSADGGTTWTSPPNAGLTTPPFGVSVDAGSASTVYAATVDDGVFTSTNGGASWRGSTNGLFPSNSNGPVQLSGIFANPATAGTVFAIAPSPDFVYSSTDFGQTWTQVNFPPGGAPEALVFSPANPNTLFLGQRNGAMLKSTDGGNTWTSLSNETVWGPQGLAILPSNPSILLAAGQSTLGRSSDGGKTWAPVLPLSLGSVAFDPRNSGVAYALDLSGLYRSTDAGQTWTRTMLPYEVQSVSLFVSPADSRVFVGEGSQTDAFVTKWSPDGSQILYSTYLGGSQFDFATGIAVDGAGSAYIAGYTGSADFPVSSNAFQKTFPGNPAGFISKLSPDGSRLVYSTLLGGGFEQSGRIAVDSAGEAVITGATTSTAFPVTPGAYQSTPVSGCSASVGTPGVQTSGSAFLSKIAADGGSLVFSTLLGGSCGTRGQALALDANGNIWIGGSTDSPDFPVTKDAWQPALGGDVYDGFLVRFTPSGGLGYATYVGGKGFDSVSGIAFDQTGNVYVTGTSGGLLQPASAGAFETQAGGGCPVFGIGPGFYQAVGSAFVLKLDPAAHTTLGLTYLGAPLCLFPSDIAVDASGEPWIGGTFSPAGSAPQTASPFQIGIGSGFVSKFSADFTQLLFSTYFNTVTGIALDSTGFAYVSGQGPVNNATGSGQAYIAKIDSTPDSTPPAVSLDSVVNVVDPASPSNYQGIGAGEVLRLLGKNLGPATLTPGIVNAGFLATTVAGVQVTFDGIPRPLLSVSAGEIDLVAPFELAGASTTTVQVLYNGAKSNAVQVAVSAHALQVLGVFNGDFFPNSASNPAKPGSPICLYLSGVGQTNPPSQDGQVNTVPPTAMPMPVTINTGQLVTFAGTAPGLAAGIFQVNFIAPQQTLNHYVQILNASARFYVFVQ